MTTSTEQTVDILANELLGVKGYTPPEQTMPVVQRLIGHGSVLLGWQGKYVLLLDQDMLPVSPEMDRIHPARNCKLLWRVEEIETQPPSSIPLPNSALGNDGEMKFVGHEQGIHVYHPNVDSTGANYYSTSDTARIPENYHRKWLDSYLPPEQPQPYTTKPIARSPSSSINSLIYEAVDLIWPPVHQMLLQRLDTLGGRPESERWPSAQWPSSRAFADARAFIYALPGHSITLPHLSFADDGEINFLWNQDGIHIDLGFYGTGAYSYFARGENDQGFYEDDVPASDGLTDAILGLLGG
jgi:hypothetical protein